MGQLAYSKHISVHEVPWDLMESVCVCVCVCVRVCVCVSLFMDVQALDQDLQKKQESLLAITEKIQPITAVLNPDDSAALRDLISQVDSHTKSLLQLENSLQVIELSLREHDQDRTKAKGDSKFQDSLRSQDSGKYQESGRFQGSGRVGENLKTSETEDSDGNYAEIDALRAQILRSCAKVPAPSLVSGQASNGSGQGSTPQSGSGRHPGGQSTSAVPPALYERVQEILPSPLADYDLVS